MNGEWTRQPFAMIALLLAFPLLWLSCNRQPSTLTPIQQQRSGDYVVSLLNDTGVLKQHSNRLTLEIRNTASNELANVNNVQIQATMRMPGMGPMFGNLLPMRQVSPGRYDFEADFSMLVQWAFLVSFDPNGSVKLNLNAQ